MASHGSQFFFISVVDFSLDLILINNYILSVVTLRDYQLKAVEDLRRTFKAGYRAPLLCLPVAGGKTVIFSYIAIAAAARGNRILILVHRQELLDQSSRHLTRLGVQHGVVAAGRTMSPENIQIASVQTLARRLERMPEWFTPQLIIT